MTYCIESVHFYQCHHRQRIKVLTDVKITNQANFHKLDLYDHVNCICVNDPNCDTMAILRRKTPCNRWFTGSICDPAVARRVVPDFQTQAANLITSISWHFIISRP